MNVNIEQSNTSKINIVYRKDIQFHFQTKPHPLESQTPGIVLFHPFPSKSTPLPIDLLSPLPPVAYFIAYAYAIGKI